MRHVLSGEPETGKSWLALHYCLTETRQGHHVLYLDHEMGPSMTAERLLALGANDNDLNHFTYIAPTEPITYAHELNDLLTTLTPTLIVIDSMTSNLATHGLDPNVAKDIEAWDQTVQRTLRRAGAAILTLDHVTKNAETRGKFAIGSERKIGICEVHLSLTTLQAFGRSRDGKARITVQKDRAGHLPRPTLGTFHLASTGLTTSASITPWEASTLPFRPTALMERVSRYLETNGPTSSTQLEKNVPGKAEGIRAAIRCLTDEGLIGSVPGDTSKWPPNTSLKPFRDTPED
jgi:hypothetical protein